MSEKTETAKTTSTKAPAAAATKVQDTYEASTPSKERFDYTKLNSLAVVSLASAISWVGAVAGVITGHIAIAQIKRSGERGKSMAVTGLLIGYFYIVGSIAFAALMMLFAVRGWVGHNDYGSFRNSNFGPGMMSGQITVDTQNMPNFNR
jgi:hypothetical protein